MRNTGSKGLGLKRGASRREGAGPSGQCICIKCNYLAPKKRGRPCMDEKCPHCGATLLREGGSHHQSALSKKK